MFLFCIIATNCHSITSNTPPSPVPSPHLLFYQVWRVIISGIVDCQTHIDCHIVLRIQNWLDFRTKRVEKKLWFRQWFKNVTLGRIVASLRPVSKYLKTVVTFSISLVVNWSSTHGSARGRGSEAVTGAFESSELCGVSGGLTHGLDSVFIPNLKKCR